MLYGSSLTQLNLHRECRSVGRRQGRDLPWRINSCSTRLDSTAAHIDLSLSFGYIRFDRLTARLTRPTKRRRLCWKYKYMKYLGWKLYIHSYIHAYMNSRRSGSRRCINKSWLSSLSQCTTVMYPWQIQEVQDRGCCFWEERTEPQQTAHYVCRFCCVFFPGKNNTYVQYV